jgi:hypothetical protein
MGDVAQQGKKSTTPQQFEEDLINLMTMRNIKLFAQNQMKGNLLFNA